MRVKNLFFILSFLFLSENIFAQQLPIKNDSSSLGIEKLQLSFQFYLLSLMAPNVKTGVGLKINEKYRLNLIGAYGKKEIGWFPYNEHDNVSYKNRLKFEFQAQRKFDKYPSIFIAPYFSYCQATIISYHDTGQYNFRASESYSKIISPGGIIGFHDEFLYHFGFECYAGVGYKFQIGDYSGSYFDTFRTYQSGISFRAEASFYFNFYREKDSALKNYLYE